MFRRCRYHSIRIDSVHYCEREIDLSEKRKRKSRFNHNAIPEDTAAQRLRLLCRTLREDPTRLGVLVRYFKTPYMLRESKATADFARCIAVLPNLHYVDLPSGFYSDEAGYSTLRLEVETRCPDLRKMTYDHGSEHSLEDLSKGTIWVNLEVLELRRLDIEPSRLRYVLAALSRLRALKISEMDVNDELFLHDDIMLPPIPPVDELVLKDVPELTATGLASYLSTTASQRNLKVLSLENTGIRPWTLHEVLAAATGLKTLAITEEVETAFPTAAQRQVPPLVNWSLETLRYEITAPRNNSTYRNTTTGYYNYLASSLFAGGLPLLAAVYVYDLNFPDMLLGLPPPVPGFVPDRLRPSSSASDKMFSPNGPLLSPTSPTRNSISQQQPRFSSNNPFASAVGNANTPFAPRGPAHLSLNQTLEVFTKGSNDLSWGVVRMDPIDLGGPRRGSAGHGRSGSGSSPRPISHYGLNEPVGVPWDARNGTRLSVFMGDGAGGFLSLPNDEADGAANGRRGSSASISGSVHRPPFAGGGGQDLWPRPTSSAGIKKDRDLWR